MLSISAKKREEGTQSNVLRSQGIIPAILYGPATENTSLAVDAKAFRKVYEEAGESSLITVDAEGKQHIVLVHETQRDPLSGEITHIDFYQPKLNEKIDITVPIEIEGEAPAVKDLGGTLMRNLHEVEVRALPQDLPHGFQVDVSKLATFEDRILVKDLAHSDAFEILAEPDEIVAMVAPPEDVEGELAKPIEEQVEQVESVDKKEAAPEEEEPSS